MPKVDFVHIFNAAIRTEVMHCRTHTIFYITVVYQECYKRRALFISFHGELRIQISPPLPNTRVRFLIHPVSAIDQIVLFLKVSPIYYYHTLRVKFSKVICKRPS